MTRLILAAVTVGLLTAACGGGSSAEGAAEPLSQAAPSAAIQTQTASTATPIVVGEQAQTPSATLPPATTSTPAEAPPEITVAPLGDPVERGIAPVTPANFKDAFLPLVRSAYELVTREALSDRISIDILDAFIFVDGSKYAETGTMTGPAFVQLGNDGAIHIFLRATTFVRAVNAIGVELGHAVQREKMGNESYRALREARLGHGFGEGQGIPASVLTWTGAAGGAAVWTQGPGHDYLDK